MELSGSTFSTKWDFTENRSEGEPPLAGAYVLIYISNMNLRTSLTRRLQQLRWKLTLSYMGVTVAVLVTLECILLAALGIWLIGLVNSGVLPQQLIEEGARYTPGLRAYLSETPPDQQGIAQSLEWVKAATSPTLPLSFDANDEMLVVGVDGTLLGSTPTDLLGADMVGQPFDPQSIPGSAAPLEAALAGTEDIERLYTLKNPSGQVVLAIPVWDADHRYVLGAAIAVTEAPTVWSILRELVPILGMSLLIFTVVAGLTGIPFGYLAARGLVHRFDQFAGATLAWSQGDFSAAINEKSEDELGQLAHRLNSMAEQLQSLFVTRQMLAVAEERNRLARDLHDSAKQQAFAAAAQLDAVQALIKRDPDAASSHISEAVRLVDELRQELTTLIRELRPVVLQRKGLERAVRDYVAGWSRQNGITPEIRIQGDRLLPPKVEQTMFRVIQEALSNVARHSRATHVEILLTYNTNSVSLTIHDDGVGFEPETIAQGLGLRSMQERAESLGGHFTIESTLDQGTRLKCVVPVDPSVAVDTEWSNG